MTNRVENYTKEIIRIANDNRHGYSQYNRWGNPDFDCSSLVITVVENSGIPVKTNGATYTGNMLNPFLKSGFKDVTSSINLKTGGGLKRGDILLNTNNHTEIYIGNGKITGARGSETGGIHGQPGDQTGKEIRTSNYYNYPWNYVLRFPNSNTTSKLDSHVEQFARAVIQGKYGNGQARKNNIYNTVQKEVNNILAKRTLRNDYITVFAREVISGKYGNGKARKENLYKTVQGGVNRLL